MLRVYVDKRITIGQLKTEMQRWVGVSHEHFKLFKIYSNSQEFECTKMTETLASYGDNTRLSVRLGRALLPGEQRGKVYMLEPDNIDDPARFLIDWVVCKGDTVGSAKKAIVKEVNTRCNMNLIPENVRLRKKSWKNPQTIYLDDQKFDDDISLYSNWELFLQVIEGPEPRRSNAEELAIFVKRWRPSMYTTDPLVEIIISKPTAEVLKEKLSEISGIEAENIEFAKGKGTFPCDMSVMDITNDLDWTVRSSQLDQRPFYILDDGSMIYYRDKTEKLKELTEDERRELVKSENRRLNRDLQYSCPSSSTTYSTLRSKEKGLKIYLNHED
nr:ubiquitin carboxyl-terminal hydrolase 47-like [Cherax quadricarinatus]